MRHQLHSSFKLAATTLAVSAMLAACGGGGDASGPADTTPPTVAITDNVSAATATANVTFTFTFSEAINGFTADDVTVTNGTKGAFAMASDKLSATLVVTPTANSAGTINVSIAASAFADIAGNNNTQSASASQAFDTTPPVPAAYISFDETPEIVTGIGAYGGALPEVTTGPTGGNAKALKIAKPAGSGNESWGGTYFNVPRVPFTSAQKAITARVYSTVANAVIRLKVEVPGGASVEVAGTTVAQANTWTTVTWNFSAADLAANYTVLAVTPDLDRALNGAVYYIDEINVVDTPVTTVSTFASSFSGGNNTTAEAGSFGGYSGGSEDGWNCTNANSFCGLGLNDAAGKDRLYYYYVAPRTTTGLYSGVYVMAPGLTALNGTVTGFNISGKSKFKFTAGQNPEWFQSNDKNFGVMFNMANAYSVSGGTNNCRIQLWQVVTPTSDADSAYSINLSDFRVVQDCGTGLSAGQVLAQQTIAQIDFKANGGSAKLGAGANDPREGANLNVANGDGLYPTTIVVKGPLQFE